MGRALSGLAKRPWAGWIAIAALLVAAARVSGLTHDESQYVDATALAVHGLPYRDFAYLQTPLQPIVLAPLAWAFPAQLFLLSRLANALFGLAVAALTFTAARRVGTGPLAAWIATVLMVLCHGFLYSSGVARNDALPAAALAGALALLMTSSAGWRLVAAGLLLGAATAAKISFALPAAAIVLAQLPWRGEGGIRRAGLITVGAIPFILLVGWLAAQAPDAFRFEVFSYPSEAPRLWYDEIGHGHRLGFRHHLLLFAGLAQGAALIGLLVVGWRAWSDRRRWPNALGERTLIAAAAGGLVAAALPNPFNPPYLMPLLPPLFVLLALAIERGGRPSRWVVAAVAATVLWGLYPTASAAVKAVKHGLPVVALKRDGRAIGQALEDGGVTGPVATLNGQFVAGVGLPVDARFAAGPFLYRTRGLMTENQLRAFPAITRDSDALFAERPPAAILTGFEARKKKSSRLDQRLDDQARRLGFVPAATTGMWTLWLPPANAAIMAARRSRPPS